MNTKYINNEDIISNDEDEYEDENEDEDEDEDKDEDEYTDSNDEDLISNSSDDNIDQIENLDLNYKIINNYNVIYEIGRGACSIVWLVYNINNQHFYALKVQNPTEYNEGLDEIKFVKKLPENPNVFNNIIDSFIEFINNKKYLCSVWNLHCTNIDTLIRKNELILSINNVKHIMNQLILAIKILHQNFKVFHGDIKTDNILIKGINDKDAFAISEYIKENFNEKYINEKKIFWTDKGNSLNSINNINKNDKLRIRQNIHKKIVENIMEKIINNNNFSKYSINSKYLEKIDISLADFGTHCSENNYYDEPFGTRYYQAPEIILMGKCSYPVDIWALGCTFYELLTGELIFIPDKDSKHSRDYYHLCLINDICGDFSPNFLKKTKYYNNFFDSKYKIKDRDIKNNKLKINIDTLDDYNKKIILNILTQMLEIDPIKRINILSLSKQPFFT